MYVKIGPYKNWIGPYQIADKIFFWVQKYPDANLENRWDYRLHERFGDWLADTWVTNFCNWIDSKRKRKIKVHIDRWDTWNMDHTLALIILPMLKQIHKTKLGSPTVDDDDVPEHLRRDPNLEGENKNWDMVHERWDWVLNELIWTFEQLVDEDSDQQFYSGEHDDTFAVDRGGLHAWNKRIDNGLMLFGKYYRGLWD